MLIFLLLLLFVSSSLCDISQTKHGTSINVLGKSGKITLSRGDASVMITMDSMREVDNSGNSVGNVGSVKHSIQTFATTDFIFTDLVETSYQNLSCSSFSFHSISDVGKIQIDTYLFDSSGSVSTENETWKLSTGDMKFNIHLLDWNFCNPCADGTAAFIDIDIEIKGQKTQKTNKTIDVGGASVQLSNEIVVDSKSINMEDGYPKQKIVGEKTVYTFRFPTFQNQALYDPVVQFSSDSSEDQPTSLGSIHRIHTFIALLTIVHILYYREDYGDLPYL